MSTVALPAIESQNGAQQPPRTAVVAAADVEEKAQLVADSLDLSTFDPRSLNVNDGESRDFEIHMRALEIKRRNAEDRGDYGEAAQADRLHSSLRKTTVERRVQVMKEEHAGELGATREVFESEHSAVMTEWDAKIAEFQRSADRAQAELKDRHTTSLESAADSFAAARLAPPRLSRKLLELRKIESTLVGSRDYNGAAKTQAKADALEQKEVAAAQEKVTKTWKHRILQLRKKCHSELSALQQKHSTLRLDLQKERDSESQRLERRTKIVLSDLNSKQVAAARRVEKYAHATAFMDAYGRSGSSMSSSVRATTPRGGGGGGAQSSRTLRSGYGSTTTTPYATAKRARRRPLSTASRGMSPRSPRRSGSRPSGGSNGSGAVGGSLPVRPLQSSTTSKPNGGGGIIRRGGPGTPKGFSSRSGNNSPRRASATDGAFNRSFPPPANNSNQRKRSSESAYRATRLDAKRSAAAGPRSIYADGREYASRS